MIYFMIDRLAVHEITTADYAQVKTLALFTLDALYNEPQPDDIFVQMQIENMQGSTVISAHDKEEMIIAIAAFKIGPACQEASIVDVATAITARENGIGREVIGFLEQVAGRKAVEQLVVQPLPSAARFYEKLGYVADTINPRIYTKSL
jgi:predicted acetyltransferase